jgi:Tfp pilus assembly protein PilO
MNISKMKSNTIQKIIFSSVVILLLVIFNIFAFITTNNQTEKIVEINKEIFIESTTTINLSDTKRKIEELKKIESRLDGILIDEGKIVNFISMVEELSDDLNVGIKIQNVDFNDFKEDKGKELGELTMEFQISGSWKQVTTFLNSIEVVPYLVNIQSLRLSAVGQSGVVSWNANFTLKGITN